MRVFAIIIGMIILAGCGTSKNTPSTNGASAEEAQLRRYEAEFRPSDHDPVPATAGGVQTSSTVLEHDHAPADTANTSPGELVQGYRVQIYSSTNIDDANARKAEAESFFPEEWLYLQYDPPTYKIRAGNFLHRYEADRFVKLAIEKGFSEAWTVPAKVLKNPGPPPR
jgi:hypothetical protein